MKESVYVNYDASKEEAEVTTVEETSTNDEVQTGEVSKTVEEEVSTDVTAPLVINTLPDLIVNERIKERIPQMNAEEYLLLEKSILSDGCRDAIIAWNNTIVDGHNRYDICKKHNVVFKVTDKQFTDIEECLDFVDANQLGRRNLTNDQRMIIIGRRYNREKKKQGEHKGNQHTKKESGQIVQIPSTSEKIANENKIDEKTVRRYGKTANAFDMMQDENPELAKDIFQGKKSLKDFNKKKRNEKKASAALSSEGDANIPASPTSSKAIGTVAAPKTATVEPDHDEIFVLTEKQVMTYIKKAKEKVIELQDKMKVVSKEVVKVHTKILGNSDTTAIAELGEQIKLLGQRKDELKYEVSVVLKDLGYLLVFDTKFNKTKMSGYDKQVKYC
jgi:hypothetical protein